MSRRILQRRLLKLFVTLMFASLITGRAEQQNLTVCFMNEHGSDELFYNFDRHGAAATLAIQYANAVILPKNMTLVPVFTLGESFCPTKVHAVAYAMELYKTGIDCDVYMGPGCTASAEALYEFVNALDNLLIGLPAGGIGLQASIDSYHLLSRLSITHINSANAMIFFARQFNYTDMTIIYDNENSFYQPLGVVAQEIFRQRAFDLLSGTRFIDSDPKNLTDRTIRYHLQSNMNRCRVYMFLVVSDAVRRYMLMARSLGMTSGDYVFLGINMYRSKVWGNFSYRNHDRHDDAAREAYQSLLFLALAPSSSVEYNIFAGNMEKLSRTMYNYTYKGDDEVDIISTHFYDAVIFYATLVRNVSDLGLDYRSGDILGNAYAAGFSFYSPVNGPVLIDENGDRRSYYILQNFDPTFGQHMEYMSISPYGEFTLRGQLNWPSGETSLPPNTPPCGFLNNDPSCFLGLSVSTIVAAAVIPVVLLGTFIAVGVWYGKRFMEKHSDPYWWRIFLHELTFEGGTGRATTVSVNGSSLAPDKEKELHEDDDLKHEKISLAAASAVSATNRSVKKATYAGNPVMLVEMHKPIQRVSPLIGRSLAPIKRLQHQNIQKFYGIAVNDENLCEYIVGDPCNKGTLTYLLEVDTMDLDWDFKCALFKDLTAGMTYLHSTPLISTGNLTSHVCLIDSSFVLKISQYGLHYFRSEEDFSMVTERDDDRDFEELLWRAPELMRQHMPPQGTQKGDVYSYSIVIQQILLRSLPFRTNDISRQSLPARDLVMEVKRGAIPPLRPRVPLSACSSEFRDLLEFCWDENPLARPPFLRIKESMTKILGKSGDNIVDYLIRTMERQAVKLEQEAENKTKQFMEEKRRSENILSQILPKSVAAQLTKGKMVLPETFASTTVHFSDIDGFSELVAEARTPQDSVSILNSIYNALDNIVEKYDVYKVETVKDAYMVVSGLPLRNGIKHAGEIADMGLAMRREIAVLKLSGLSFVSQVKLRLRVGVHSGSCVASVIGLKMPKYCLFGDTVNTSSRMESHGEPGKIQLSISTKILLDQLNGYIMISRGEIMVKGKGVMETFWLISREQI